MVQGISKDKSNMYFFQSHTTKWWGRKIEIYFLKSCCLKEETETIKNKLVKIPISGVFVYEKISNIESLDKETWHAQTYKINICDPWNLLSNT